MKYTLEQLQNTNNFKRIEKEEPFFSEFLKYLIEQDENFISIHKDNNFYFSNYVDDFNNKINLERLNYHFEHCAFEFQYFLENDLTFSEKIKTFLEENNVSSENTLTYNQLSKLLSTFSQENKSLIDFYDNLDKELEEQLSKIIYDKFWSWQLEHPTEQSKKAQENNFYNKLNNQVNFKNFLLENEIVYIYTDGIFNQFKNKESAIFDFYRKNMSMNDVLLEKILYELETNFNDVLMENMKEKSDNYELSFKELQILKNEEKLDKGLINTINLTQKHSL